MALPLGDNRFAKHVHVVTVVLCVLLRGARVLAQELVSVQVAFRHGDRSPIDIFPRHADDWSFIVAGQLSEIGVSQHEAFGQYLRSRYLEDTTFMDDLVTDVYHPEQVYVRSTDVDRTIGSALAMLSTLYPNQTVPIPVSSVVKLEDRLLRYWDNCPTYDAARSQVTAEMDQVAVDEFHQNDLIHIREVTGLTEEILSSDALLIRDSFDNLVGMTAHGITIEDYLQELSPRFDEFVQRYRYEQYVSRRDDERDLGSLALQTQFRDNLAAHRDTPGETPHLIFYSAHDITLIGAFDIFGMIENDESELLLPGYATSLILELWHEDVKLLHEDGDSSPYFIRARIGAPVQNESTGIWTYESTTASILCDGEMAEQCSLDVWIDQVDSMPTFDEGCCRQNTLFEESGCSDYLEDDTKDDAVCQSYRDNCPASGAMGVCGSDAIFSSSDNRCVSVLTRAQEDANRETYNALVAVIVTLVVVLVGTGAYWIYRKRSAKYANLEETEGLGRQREISPGVVLGDRETRDGGGDVETGDSAA